MMIWWEYSRKCVTVRQTDGQTDCTIHRAAWSQMKPYTHYNQNNDYTIVTWCTGTNLYPVIQYGQDHVALKMTLQTLVFWALQFYGSKF